VHPLALLVLALPLLLLQTGILHCHRHSNQLISTALISILHIINILLSILVGLLLLLLLCLLCCCVSTQKVSAAPGAALTSIFGSSSSTCFCCCG
jgi:uncharacterized BrkB/YihY/UPF0761 family membrane protein